MAVPPPAGPGPAHAGLAQAGPAAADGRGAAVTRTIALLDANAFFASCAAAADPALRGKPLVVGGDPSIRHGIVLAASYEARRAARGPVRAGMPLGQALRLLPRDTVVVPPDYVLYASVSRRMFAIMRRYTPLVEGASIDEAWMDWTGCLHLFGGDPLSMALQLKADIRRQLDILVSIGIAWSKVSAKLAAELQKPDGLTWLRPADWPNRVWPLAAEALYGIGPKTAAKLGALGCRTIGDLARADPAQLRQVFGVYGDYMVAAANGRDSGDVDPHAGDEVKSIGHSLTLPQDEGDPAGQRAILLSLADQVGRRLRRAALAARTVALQVRDAQFRTISRAQTLAVATDTSDVIYTTATELLAKHWPTGKPVRLLGVTVTHLQPVDEYMGQMTLFDDVEAVARRRRADQAADAVRDRFGEEAVVRATQLTSRRGRTLLDKRRHGTSFQREDKGAGTEPAPRRPGPQEDGGDQGQA